MSKEEFPNIGEQGKNLAKFTVKVVKDVVINTGSDNEGGVFVSDAKNKERWDICKKMCICKYMYCLVYTSPSPRDRQKSRMPSSA